MVNKEKKNDFIMKPTVDYCFKELMSVEKVRKGFIAAVLGISPETIKSVELLPTILEKHTEEEKMSILDVHVLLDNSTEIDMEMQILVHKCWKERTIYYTSRMYVESIKEGEDYGKLRKCVQISILDFVLFPEHDEFYSCYQMRERKTGRLYSDKLEIHVLELPKLNNEEDPEDALSQWALFLNSEKREDFKRMAEKNEYISEAYAALERLSLDERKKLEYDTRQKSLRDFKSLRKDGYEDGMADGQLLKGIEDIKKLMKNLGCDINRAFEILEVDEANREKIKEAMQ